MIALDSSEWDRLQHAYGPASNLPGLLRQLAKNPRPKSSSEEEPWHSLWSALCHQGDVYSASYATVPHIVQIALATEGPIDLGFFLLPACIEVARLRERGPYVPPALREAYGNALSMLSDCAFRHKNDEWDRDMTLSVAAALAVSKRQIDLAEVLINLDDERIARLVAEDTY